MKRAERERKEALLAKATGHPGETHLELLLAAYRTGEDHRAEIADNIVAKYRPILRANGPNYDGPLYADILNALEAAESHGRLKRE